MPEKQIGATGFEPAATSTPYWCANQTALRPDRQVSIIRHFFEIHKENARVGAKVRNNRPGVVSRVTP